MSHYFTKTRAMIWPIINIPFDMNDTKNSTKNENVTI